MPAVPDDPEDPAVDEAIRSALAAVPAEVWAELAAALAAVEQLDPDAYCTWTGGGARPDGTTTLPWPEDAVRLLTAVVRSERFGDGNLDGALRDGTLQAAVRRVLATR